jgi:uncharacterized protein
MDLVRLCNFCYCILGVICAYENRITGIVQWLVGGAVFDVFNAAQALLYCCLLAILFQKEKWQKRLLTFYYVGRMGLTTYLMQTLFGVFIFFSVGLGLLGDIGAFACVGLSIVLFLIQVQFSKWWFGHFFYGPVEWMWRTTTTFSLQPLKRG